MAHKIKKTVLKRLSCLHYALTAKVMFTYAMIVFFIKKKEMNSCPWTPDDSLREFSARWLSTCKHDTKFLRSVATMLPNAVFDKFADTLDDTMQIQHQKVIDSFDYSQLRRHGSCPFGFYSLKKDVGFENEAEMLDDMQKDLKICKSLERRMLYAEDIANVRRLKQLLRSYMLLHELLKTQSRSMKREREDDIEFTKEHIDYY